jgi:hypothetical protein
MRDLLILVVHIITTVFRLARPGVLRAVVAESVLTKTSDVAPKQFASPCAQSAHSGSVHRGIVFPLNQTESAP